VGLGEKGAGSRKYSGGGLSAPARKKRAHFFHLRGRNAAASGSGERRAVEPPPPTPEITLSTQKEKGGGEKKKIDCIKKGRWPVIRGPPSSQKEITVHFQEETLLGRADSLKTKPLTPSGAPRLVDKGLSEPSTEKKERLRDDLGATTEKGVRRRESEGKSCGCAAWV